MGKTTAVMVGTGFMGGVHVEALRRVGVNVLGICGSSPERGEEAAQALALPRAYASFDEVIEDDDVQVVHIGTPNHLHFMMAQRSLEAGKHVMCEKPLAMSSQESASLVQLARQHPHLAAGVNYNMRFYPLCLQAREMSRVGQLGDTVHVSGSYVQDWLTFPTDFNWRLMPEQNGPLRAVADIGTHLLDLIHMITGLEVESLCADLQTAHPVRQRPKHGVETFSGKLQSASDVEPIEITTDDYGAILLRFAGGARGCIHVSQVTPGRKNCLRLEIAGTQQSIAWNSESPNELWVGNRNQANELLLRDPTLLAPAAAEAAPYPGGHNEGYADSFKQCFRNFYAFIQSGDFDATPDYATFADGHRELLLCEAILDSHRQQRWISIAGQ